MTQSPVEPLQAAVSAVEIDTALAAACPGDSISQPFSTPLALTLFMSSLLLGFLGFRGGEGINILFRHQHSVITYPGHFEQQDTSAFFAIH